MRTFYREFREHTYDEAVKDSDEYKEKAEIRFVLENEVIEILGGISTAEYKKFDEFLSAYYDEYDVMLEEVYLLGAADRERMLRCSDDYVGTIDLVPIFSGGKLWQQQD